MRQACVPQACQAPTLLDIPYPNTIGSTKVREKHPDLISALITFGNLLKQAGGKVLALLETGDTQIPFPCPCLLPPNCAEGDIVCVVYGCALPVLLRPLPCDEYMYLGPCYASGYMDGQAMCGDEDDEEQDFVLLPGDENS
jgi:hypothetical protein